MTNLLLLFSIAAMTAPPTPTETRPIDLYPGTQVVFADVAEGRRVLATRDDYVKALSPFDRAAKLQVAGPVDEKQFTDHFKKQVQPWTAEERAKLTNVVNGVRPLLNGLRPVLPKRVLMIKTTGQEEGRAAYTRGDAIVLPQRMVNRGEQGLQRLFLHELFHVLSRHLAKTDRKRHDALYKVVGFERCQPIALPKQLAHRKITNPDAPLMEHVLPIEHDGRETHIVPILYANVERYDPKVGGTFFRHMVFRLMVVERAGEKWQAQIKDGEPVLLDPRKTPGYFEKIGRNTKYIIHPEEVLADNFVLTVRGAKDVPTPRVVDGVRAILFKRDGTD